MLKDIILEGSFVAIDKDGKKHIIDIFTDINSKASFEDPDATSEGLKHLKTRDGGNVNYLEKGKYKIVQTGVVVKSDDPHAP